ncbi:MAG: 50S ribosomal protein L7/L12 [Candidatus Dependentiae bacterium]|nr:50S ribosomal protein L7/L12 [Candidatus Dependentiae bacterium]
MVQKSFDQIIEQISGLTLLELAELVKALEEKFGVSAALPAAAAAPAAAAPEVEEKTEFKVELADGGTDKLKVIKALRGVVKDLSLSDAKKMVETAPQVIAEHVKKEDAEKMKQDLEAAGAKVKLS